MTKTRRSNSPTHHANHPVIAMRTLVLRTLFCGACLVAMPLQAQTVRFYIGTSQGEGIAMADLDTTTGVLAVPTLAIELKKPGFLAAHPTKPLLYSTTEGLTDGKEGGVAALRVNSDGSLSLINLVSSEGRGPVYLSLDATGQTLMVANYGSGSVASFQILEDGSLSDARSVHQHRGQGTDPARQRGPHAHAILPNPSNSFAYAPDLGIDKVMIYALEPAAGILTPLGSTVIPGLAMGPRHLKWSDDGAFAYVINELDLSLSVFKPGEMPGSMEFIETVPMLPAGPERAGLTAAEVRIHPNGRLVYASIRDATAQQRDAINVFSVTEHGLELLKTVPAEVSIPRTFVIDPTGQWLLIGGQRSRDVAVLKIDAETGIPASQKTKVVFDAGIMSIEAMPARQ